MGFERGPMAFVLVEETNIDKGMLPQNIVSFTLVLVRSKVWYSEDTADEIIFMVKLRSYQPETATWVLR